MRSWGLCEPCAFVWLTEQGPTLVFLFPVLVAFSELWRALQRCDFTGCAVVAQ